MKRNQTDFLECIDEQRKQQSANVFKVYTIQKWWKKNSTSEYK